MAANVRILPETYEGPAELVVVLPITRKAKGIP
jgi:hypothetical protein